MTCAETNQPTVFDTKEGTVFFRIENSDVSSGFTPTSVADGGTTIYYVSKSGESSFKIALDEYNKESDLYLRSKNVEWSVNPYPVPTMIINGLKLTLTPEITKDESYTTLKVTADESQLVNIKYEYRVIGKSKTSNIEHYFNFHVSVNFPLPKLTPHFQFNSLVIAPGETKTNLVTFDDIKPGQSYRIDHKTNNSDFLKDSWVSTTDNIFTTDKNSATWSVAVPASANPNIDDEGVNLYPTFLNTNKLIEFDGNQNGFLVYIAGYTVQSMEVKGGNSVTFGDTAKISVNYIVNGNGTFTPKITPPGVITADMLDIIMPAIEQDITTQYGKRLVKVIYYVFFKKMPTNKNVTFAVGGDITYGKAVPKQLTITLK